MYWDAKSVTPLADYRIYVELENGRRGAFDLKPYLDRGVMRELRDVHYFQQVGIVFGAVTWPHEQDIAPILCWRAWFLSHHQCIMLNENRASPSTSQLELVHRRRGWPHGQVRCPALSGR